MKPGKVLYCMLLSAVLGLALYKLGNIQMVVLSAHAYNN